MPVHITPHGHEFVAWNRELEVLLPATLKVNYPLKLVAQKSEKIIELSCIPFSFFSPPTESTINTDKQYETEMQVLRKWVGNTHGNCVVRHDASIN